MNGTNILREQICADINLKPMDNIPLLYRKMEYFETFQKEMKNFKTRTELKIFNVDGTKDVEKAAIN